jgi:hypothetical protein
MADVKIKQGVLNTTPKYISYTRKEDYKVIKLKDSEELFVEHNILADNLISRKLATEVKDVDFELGEKVIQQIGEVKN